MTTTATPPDSVVLEAALDRAHFRGPVGSVAVFLASPVTVAPGLPAGCDGRTMWLRDASTPMPEGLPGIPGAAHGASQLAARAHREGDRYLDLGAPVESWFKLMHSGTSPVAFGLDVLWGIPKVSLGAGVGADEVGAFVRLWRTAGGLQIPCLIPGPGTLIAEGTERRLTLTRLEYLPPVTESASTGAPSPGGRTLESPQQRARSAGADLANRLGGNLVSVSPGGGPRQWVVGALLGAIYVLVPFELHGDNYQAERVRVPEPRPGDLFVNVDGQLVHVATGLVCRRP